MAHAVLVSSDHILRISANIIERVGVFSASDANRVSRRETQPHSTSRESISTVCGLRTRLGEFNFGQMWETLAESHSRVSNLGEDVRTRSPLLPLTTVKNSGSGRHGLLCEFRHTDHSEDLLARPVR